MSETNFRNIRKTNWENFEQYVYANKPSFNSEIDIESKVEQLTKVLTDAFGHSTRESTKGGGVGKGEDTSGMKVFRKQDKNWVS